jgi:hypothetical protein
MGIAAKKLVLKWPYLLIALLPISVFVATDGLLHLFGDAVDQMPPYFAPFDAHREAGARLTALGMLILFIGVAIGAIAYFAGTVWLLDKASKLRVVGVFAAVMILGFLILATMKTREMQEYLGPTLVCTALGYSPWMSDQGTDPATSNSAQPKVIVPDQRPGDGCGNKRFKQLRFMLNTHKYALMLCIAAVGLGSICCLAALPGNAHTDEEELAHYEAQSGRLNIYLYLSALFLMTALFFVAAYARWPSYALLSNAAYEGHVNAFVAYLGFSYSLLIASYYVPVAAILAANYKKAGKDKAGLPDAFEGPVQLLKIVSAVSSTALAGSLPAVLGVGT